jgi:creatinine amidohydrolase
VRGTSARRAASKRADEVTSPEFARHAKAGTLFILPFGSLEEHGSHLPLGTDTMQAEEVARRVAEELGAVVLPSVGYGECRSTRNFPGTLSLSFETVRMLSQDIVSELARNGVRKVLVITGHAGSGHMAAIRLGVLRAVEACPSMMAMVLSDYDLAYELRGKEFPEDDGHAGLIETSRILNIRPELVGEERPVGRSRPPRFMVLPDPERHIPTGVMGDPRGASARKGATIDDYVVSELCKLVAEDFKIKRRKPRGGG